MMLMKSQGTGHRMLQQSMDGVDGGMRMRNVAAEVNT